MSQLPVVLVHGIASNHSHNWETHGWPDVLADEGRPVIPFELPGHGAGELAPDADDVAALLAAVRAAGPVDAIGFSAGAALLLRTVVREPAAFRRLVLIGIGDGLLQDGDGGETIAAALSADEEPVDPQPRLFWRLVRSAGNDRRSVAAYLRSRRGPAVTTDQLATLPNPVLVILGDRDFVGPADGLVHAMPAGELLRVRGADHFGITGDARCMDAAVRFLERTG